MAVPRSAEVKFLLICLILTAGLFAVLSVSRVRKSAAGAMAEGGGKVIAATVADLAPRTVGTTVAAPMKTPGNPAARAASAGKEPEHGGAAWPKGASLFRPMPSTSAH